MDQVTVVGRRSVAKDVLAALQGLGVMQVTRLAPEAEEEALQAMRLRGGDLAEREAWERVLSRSTALLDVLGIDAAAAARGPAVTNASAAEAEVREAGEQIDRLVAERSELRDELELIETYLPLMRDLAPMLAQVESSRYLAGAAFLADESDLEDLERRLRSEFGEGFVLARRPRGGQALVVAAVMRGDAANFRSALARAGVSELQLPERYQDQGVAKATHSMEERSQVVPRRLATVEEELRKLAAKHGERLAQLNLHARNVTARLAATENLLEGRYGFALRGWVPSDAREHVLRSLEGQFGGDVAVAWRPADEHHDTGVPVKLDNPAWVRPFQGLLALFAPPRYGSFDPSWTLAVFFPLYFGIVLGDIGFGLVFAVLALLLRRRGAQGKPLGLGPLGITIPPQLLAPISTVILWCSAWAVAWGFVFGEFFGNFLEHFPPARPVFYAGGHGEAHGLIEILLFRVEEFTPLLLITLGFGIFQVLFGWAIRVREGLKHHDMGHVYEGVGMFAGLSGIIVFAWAYLSGNLGALTMTIAGLGLLVFVACAVLAKMPLMLLEIISNSGHILSFLRLFAVGLSAALVANLSTDLGFGLAGVLPVIGPILGIAVALVVHALAIALTIIGHTLQPLRLQYVEFFTKFGFYDEAGTPYNPLRLVGGKS
jgi:V/A-type H+-transporting ATPase subunit I